MENKPKRSTFRARLEVMITTLRHEILTGEREVGSFLPSELDIAKIFNLSKNSVRKGLEVLESEALIEKVPRVGSRILKLSDRVTINFGYYPSLIIESNLNALVEKFHQKYPHIHLNMIPVRFHHSSPTLKDYLESDEIDVISINNHNFELFSDKGQKPQLLEPLYSTEGIYPFLTEPFVRDGSLYVQPFIFSPVILCYNKQHFIDSNVPEPDSSWTWETVKQASSQLTEGKDRYGLFFHFLSDNRWPIFLLQNGVAFQRGNDIVEPKVDLGALKESLQTLMDLVEHVFPPFLSEDHYDTNMLFLQQKVSMILTTYYALNFFRDADFEYDISPIPYLKYPKTLLNIIGFGINKNSKHKEAAKIFIDFMSSYKTQLSIRQNTLSIPSLKSAAEATLDGQGSVNTPSRYYIYRETIPTFTDHTALNITYSELIKVRQQVKLYLSKLEDLDVFI